MINVNRKEFRDSFKRNYNCYKSVTGYDKTRRLLLFYSVECGLKSLILEDIGENTYQDLLNYEGMEEIKKDGHNLKFMLKKLGAEAKFCLKPIRIKNKRENIHPNEFNQLWRYGVQSAEDQDERQAEIMLRSIAQWIDEKL